MDDEDDVEAVTLVTDLVPGVKLEAVLHQHCSLSAGMLYASAALPLLLTVPATAGPVAHCLLPVEGHDGGVHPPCLLISVPRSDGGLQDRLALPLPVVPVLLLATRLALMAGLVRPAPGLACSPEHNLLFFPGLW